MASYACTITFNIYYISRLNHNPDSLFPQRMIKIAKDRKKHHFNSSTLSHFITFRFSVLNQRVKASASSGKKR